MKWIDIPPMWLLGCAVLAWVSRWIWSAGSPVLRVAGTALVVVGLLMMLVAVVQMVRLRTTPIPHQEASALVTDGIFGISRNPIYLGNTIATIGLGLVFESAWFFLAAVVVVAASMYLNKKKITLTGLSIGVDFLQVVSSHLSGILGSVDKYTTCHQHRFPGGDQPCNHGQQHHCQADRDILTYFT